MYGLNKKIPSQARIRDLLHGISILNILLFSGFYAFSEIHVFKGIAFSELISLSAASIILLFSVYRTRSTLLLVCVYGLNSAGVIGTVSILMVGIVIYFLNSILIQKIGEFSLVVLANVSHFGDALTTYIGLTNNLTESNIFVNKMVSDYGAFSVFGIKLLIIPLTLYPFFYLPKGSRDIFLKTVFGIGMALTCRNILVLL